VQIFLSCARELDQVELEVVAEATSCITADHVALLRASPKRKRKRKRTKTLCAS
jgi:tRNA/tmRNA/rRNA uracil-C5-methylase (TrmA/RlmC/RlmD family)